MKQTIDDLVGKTVQEVSRAYETLSLIFSGGFIVAFYATQKLEGLDSEEQLVGKKVDDVSVKPDSLELEFQGGAKLIIDRREEAANGPEQLAMTYPDGRFEVWDYAD